MLATKNLRAGSTILFVAWLLVLVGCTPAGPRALFEGKKLLEKGRYPEAVEKLTAATTLMKTNAQVWNYLGLACHRAGDPVRAAKAYQQALILDRELFEARFNLGCLLLEQGKADMAKTEFTACTLRRGNSVESWAKLANAQYRLGEYTAAEESYRQVLKYNPNDPEALNGMGVIQLQRRKPQDAARIFVLALKERPDYRPALLNLASVSHRQLNDPTAALQRYREYLALEPRDSEWAEVNAVAQALQQQLAPPPVPVRPVVVTPPPPPPTNPITRTTPTPVSPPPTQTYATVKPAPPSPAPAPVRNVSLPPVASTPHPAPVVTTPLLEHVQLPPEPVIRTTPDNASTPPTTSVTPLPPVVQEDSSTDSVIVSGPVPKDEKRGFLGRLNPFRRDPKMATSPTNNAASEVRPAPATARIANANERYRYLAPAPPAAGNRGEAERAYAQGAQARDARRLAEAVQGFSRAVQLDGSFYEARYSLGVAQYDQRNFAAALSTWEYALATKPEANEARYNFALTLKGAGYAQDSAGELEKILAVSSKDVRAHLVLGNLYAEQLNSPAKARLHYQKVLDLDPRHPQATAIRYWMVANPP